MENKSTNIVQAGKIYQGTIESWPDKENRGRYKVSIPVLGAYKEHRLIVQNETTSWGFNSLGNDSFGSYFPLFPDTKVNVVFKKDDDRLSGGIISTIPAGTNKRGADSKTSDLPFGTESRDDIYMVCKTKSLGSGLWFFDNSKEYGRSTHWSYNKGSSSIVMSDGGMSQETVGVHTCKSAEYKLETTANSTDTCGWDKDIYAENNMMITAGNDVDFKSKNNFTVESKEGNLVLRSSSKSVSLYADKALNMTSGKEIFMLAKEILIAASDKIKLMVGGNQIEFSSSGIKINGMEIAISGKTKTKIESNVEVLVNSAKTTVASTGPLTLESKAMISLAAPAAACGSIATTSVGLGSPPPIGTTPPPVPVVVNPVEDKLKEQAAFLDFFPIPSMDIFPFVGEDEMYKLKNIYVPPVSLSTLSAKTASKLKLTKSPKIKSV